MGSKDTLDVSEKRKKTFAPVGIGTPHRPARDIVNEIGYLNLVSNLYNARS